MTAKYSQTVTPFELPDLHQNLPHQKLQMVNMCIVCGDVASTVEDTQSESCVRRARQRLAAQVEKLQAQLLSNEEGAENETKVENRDTEMDERTGSVDTDGASHISDVSTPSTTTASAAYTEAERTECLRELLAMNISTRDLSHVQAPRLQRRLPMTSDALAQHRHLANKLRDGSSRSASENTLLRWQILYPELMSDVRAFKACNNTVSSTYRATDASAVGCEDKVVTFEDFVVWYGGAGVLLPRLLSADEGQGGDVPGGEQYLNNKRGIDGITLENLKVCNEFLPRKLDVIYTNNSHDMM
jgi:hypothetical protein